jgi:hypothetical protein
MATLMRCFLLTALCVSAGLEFAAEMPSGFFRGNFAVLNGTTAAGELTARAHDGETFECAYDSRSYFERDKERILPTKLAVGDSIEVLADRKPGSRTCYARIVHVLGLEPVRRPSRTPQRASRQDLLPARGDRTFAGIVVRHDTARLTIRTRAGERSLALRPDTRYLGDGARVDASGIPVNAHVFVRAGRDLYGQLEAYQVMWGEIVKAP